MIVDFEQLVDAPYAARPRRSARVFALEDVDAYPLGNE
jgi:hypothetical protein